MAEQIRKNGNGQDKEAVEKYAKEYEKKKKIVYVRNLILWRT